MFKQSKLVLLSLSTLFKLVIWLLVPSLYCQADITLEGTIYKQLFDVKATSIYQDKFGYIWLGSTNGLYRFDGQEILKVPDARVSNFKIDSLIENDHGDIWIGGARGVFKVNPFTLESSKIDLNCESELSCNVQSLAYHSNTLWIGTHAGLFKYLDLGEKAAEPKHPISFPNDYPFARIPEFENIPIYSLLVEPDGHLLIGTEKGLFQYTMSTGKTNNIALGHTDNNNDRGIYSLIRKDESTLYAGGKSVLYKLDTQYKIIKTFRHKKLQSRIWSLAADNREQLWIGTISDGLFRLKSDFNRIDGIELIDKTGQNINVQRVSRSIIDTAGNFWATTDTGIFFQLSREKQNITYLSHKPLEGQPYIHTIFKHSETLYYSNLGKGLSAIDIQSGNTIPTDHVNKMLKDHNISSLTSDRNQNLWMGTYNGVAVYSPKQNAVIYNETTKTEPKAILRLYLDSYNRMWVGGFRKIGYFEDGDFSKYNDLHQDTRTFYTSYIEFQGRLIIGASDGLYLYKPEDNAIEKLRFLDNQISEELWVTHLQTVNSDLIISTRNGVRIITQSDFSDLTQPIPTGPLLFNNYEVVASYYSKGNIFAFTKLGLMKYNSLKNKYQKINSFEYNIGSFFEEKDKRKPNIFVASEKGISIIDKNVDDKNKFHPSEIKLSNFTIDEQAINIATASRNEKKLHTRAFDVSHLHNQIGLAFSNFEFNSGYPMMLEYSLNRNTDWLKMSGGSSISLQTLSPGPHQILVRQPGAFVDPLSILINVSIPWWRSTVFKIVLALLSIGLVILLAVLYSHIRHARIIRRNNELERAIAIRTLEISESSKLIEQQASRLEQLIKVKDELFINLTHELKTPLSLIMCPLNLIKNQIDDTQSLELIELAELNGSRLLRDINHLLDIDSSVFNTTSSPEIHNFSDLTSFYVTSFKDLLAEKGIKIEVNYPNDIFVLCSPEFIEKIVINLMSNLIKYTPERASGLISIESDQEYGILRISNEGSFIPEGMTSIIFERFTRLEQHQTIFGTGIGLALVKQLTEAQGGKVHVDSSPETGTCFSVYIPLSFEDNRENLAPLSKLLADNEANTLRFLMPQMPEESNADGKPGILIIEDNKELAQCLAIGLQKNFNVMTANDGKSGLDCALKYMPDLVITDIKLPEKDGLEICKELKNNSRTMHIPVVVLTANSSAVNRASAWQLLADEFIEKPFEWSMLEQRVSGLLKTRDKIKRKLALDYVINEHVDTSENQLPSPVKNKMERIKQIISENYHVYDFGPDELAKAIGMSKRNLTRQAKELIGTTPMEYIKSYRLKQSKILLSKGLPVTRVSEEVGIKSHSQFSRAFRERYGQSPSAYQKQESEKNCAT